MNFKEQLHVYVIVGLNDGTISIFRLNFEQNEIETFYSQYIFNKPVSKIGFNSTRDAIYLSDTENENAILYNPGKFNPASIMKDFVD